MIGRGLPIGSVRGCEVRVHLSWILVLGLLAASLGTGALPARYPLWPSWLAWLVATLSALGLFGGFLLHEVAHILVSSWAGVPPGPVTLFLPGSASPLEGGAKTPGREAAIAIIGPVTSILVSIAAVAIALYLGGPVVEQVSGRAATLATVIGEVLLSAGILNGLVGAMNLIPVYPLDGARLVRAVAWRLSGDPRRGTHVAALVGQVTGFAFVGLGVAIVAVSDPVFGLVVILLGWFMRNTSAVVGKRDDLERLVAGMLVGEAMERDLPTIPPQVTLDTFAELLTGTGHATVLPVIGGDDLLGLVGHSALRRAGRKSWPNLHARDVMARAEVLPRVRASDPLRPAIALLHAARTDGIPVFEEDRFTGVLTRYGVGRVLRERGAARPRFGAGATPPGGGESPNG